MNVITGSASSSRSIHWNHITYSFVALIRIYIHTNICVLVMADMCACHPTRYLSFIPKVFFVVAVLISILSLLVALINLVGQSSILFLKANKRIHIFAPFTENVKSLTGTRQSRQFDEILEESHVGCHGVVGILRQITRLLLLLPFCQHKCHEYCILCICRCSGSQFSYFCHKLFQNVT